MPIFYQKEYGARSWVSLAAWDLALGPAKQTNYTFCAIGKRKKNTYNLSGLRNQSTSNNIPEVPDNPATHTDEEESDWQPHVVFDSLKPDLPAEDEKSDKDEDAEAEWDSEWNENERFGSQDLQAAMIRFAVAIGDDPRDEDWVPPKMRVKRECAKEEKRGESQWLLSNEWITHYSVIPERQTEYIKGPDVGSKSERTQRRYKSLLKDQSCLDT